MDLTEKFPKCQSYPPVPNWYSSSVTSIVEPHFFLYATRNCVVVLDLETLRYFHSFTVSNEKVQAIEAHKSFCFTAGVDKTVRVWNIVLGSLVTSHNEHKAEITVLKLVRHGTILVSGDKAGKIVLIEPFEKQLKYIETKVKAEITSIAVMRYQEQDYMAVGYINGMIFIERIRDDLSMETVFQLTNDNDLIQSLDWQKLAHNYTNPSDQEICDPAWPLLASSTKRKRNITIWKFPSQTKVTSIRLPNPPAQATEQQKSTVWIELAWSPQQINKLYFSSYIGSIVCFDITNKGPKICNNERLEKHNRNVFTINWFNQGRNCITTSLDKQVNKWDVKKKACIQSLKTQTAFPYALDTPNWDPGQLAVGMGDNSIKLWHFSTSGSIMKANRYHDYYEASILWKGLQGKIEKLKWHPMKEGFLAYANEYGHVGMYDTFNLKHISFKTYHKCQSAAYIDWGSDMTLALEDTDMKDTLLSCGGDGIIHVYDIDNPQAPPINLNERLQEMNMSWFISLKAANSSRHAMSISNDKKYIAFGHTDGLVEVYSMDTLKLVYVSNCQRHLIRSLDWKSINDQLLLASGCDKGDIAIHDMSTINTENTPDIPIPQPEPLYFLKGHKKGITDLKWSLVNTEAIIASASEDNFVVVWNVLNQEPIALFDQHRSRALSVCWNRLSPHTLFSGSEDRFLFEWSYKDYPCSGPVQVHSTLYDKEKAVLRQNNNQSKRKADALNAEAVSSADSNTSSQSTTFSLKKKQKKTASIKTLEGTVPGSWTLPLSQESEKSTSRLKKEQYCLLFADEILNGKVRQAVERLRIERLTDEEKQDPTTTRYLDFWKEGDSSPERKQNIHELLLGDKNDVRRLLELEAKALEDKTEASTSELSYAVQNNIKNDIDIKLAMAIANAQYTMFDSSQIDLNTNSCIMDWVILALSPVAGKQNWVDLMVKQAKKLESLKQYNLSVSCYIACSHVYDAVEVYRRHGLYREAIALAKLRLPPKDPVIKALFADWAKELQKGEQDILTATCFIASEVTGSISMAINLLARCGKEASLFYAASLAIASDDSTKEQRTEQWINKLRERLSKKNSDDTAEEAN